MYGKVKESGLTEIILFICPSAVWGVVSCVFRCLSSLELIVGSGCSLTAAWLQILFFFLGACRRRNSHFRPESLMGMTSLFTDVAGNTPFFTDKRDLYSYQERINNESSKVTEEGTGLKRTPRPSGRDQNALLWVFRSAGMDGEGPLQDLVEGGEMDSEGQQIPEMKIKACGSDAPILGWGGNRRCLWVSGAPGCGCCLCLWAADFEPLKMAVSNSNHGVIKRESWEPQSFGPGGTVWSV